jgi:hypothetical protein
MIVIAVLLFLSLTVVSAADSNRQQQAPAIDGPGCDSKSIGKITPAWEVSSFKHKTFSGCTIRSGEVAVITNRMNVPIRVACSRQIRGPRQRLPATDEREELSTSSSPNDLEPNHSFILNVYVNIEDMFGPKWHCIVKRSDPGFADMLLFNPFSDWKKRETFEYVITRSGLYESDPRLAERWRLPPSVTSTPAV